MMVRYEPIRTGKGRIRRVLLRYMRVAGVVDDEWYYIVTANPDNTPSFCTKFPKTREAYVKIREWHRGCEWVNVYARVED
jgi:hypothetical protein